MSQKILFEENVRSSALEGATVVNDAVKVTLGPKGRNVIISNGFGAPRVTKDGVTVAREVNVDDPVSNVGAQMIKQAAAKTADMAGDGTTTATILAHAILRSGIRLVASGANPMDVKRGIDKAVQHIVKNINKVAVAVNANNKAIKHVATISANNDSEIGELIAGMMAKIGKDGVIYVEDSKTSETTTRTVEGLMFDKGYLAPHFITDPDKMIVELDQPYILLLDKKVTDFREIQKICEQIMQSRKPALVIADDVAGAALTAMVVNKLKGAVTVVPVRAPSFASRRTDIMNDIALITGASFVTDSSGLKLDNINLTHLGKADKIIVTKDSTTIVGGKGLKSDINTKVDQLREAADEWSLERIAKIVGGVAIISVGAPTEIEISEKKDRIDDAYRATKAATEEGIVAGGGTAFIRAAEGLMSIKTENEDEKSGIKLIGKAIEVPLIQMCMNGGEDYADILSQVKKAKGNFGYNSKKGKMEDLIKSGVIDPAKVLRVALENAASVASMIMISECMMVNIEDQNVN